ncbi:hypothetical protein N0V95_007481 [Ascochyta clinopodiicola]|nr:hypothetical protein N0V95_007481 [Ascochyta clinopodiicola]
MCISITMDAEQRIDIETIVNRLLDLTPAQRTASLTHLSNLRTAAIEDLTDPADTHQYWTVVLGPPAQPDTVKDLVRDLTQLSDEELAIVNAQVAKRSSVANEKALKSADEGEREKLQTQLASSARKARESYVAAQRGLNMQHNRRLVDKMKNIRDAIEHGIDTSQDVTALEDVFARIEREFWDSCPGLEGDSQ